MTVHDIKEAAIKYAKEKHGNDPEMQPDRWEAVAGFEAGCKFMIEKCIIPLESDIEDNEYKK